MDSEGARVLKENDKGIRGLVEFPSLKIGMEIIVLMEIFWGKQKREGG